jgi:hypothetical protein
MLDEKEKEKNWWKKYMNEDKNILRPFDGYEYFLTISYLFISDIFPKFSYDDFILSANINLPNIEIFNYQVKYIENHPFWYKKEFQLIKNLNIFDLTNSEIYEKDYMKYLLKEHKVEFIEILDPNDNLLRLPYKIEIIQLEKETQLNFYSLHAMCDGRTIFNIFDYIRKIIDYITKEENKLKLNEKFLPIIKSQLCDFGQLNNYINLDKKYYEKPPEKWDEIPFKNILPELKIEKGKKNYYYNKHFIFSYPKIEKFCKENKISPQSMLTTMITRSTRKYYNLPNETPIYNYTPCDSRKSNFANDYLKKREFFCGAGALFPKTLGNNNLINEIKYNYNSMKECILNLENISQIMRSALTINKDTLKFIPENKMPNFNLQSCTCSSHIGKINGKLPCFEIWLNLPFNCENDYILAFHAYHNDEYFIINMLKPNGFNEEFLKVILNEMNIIFNCEIK